MTRNDCKTLDEINQQLIDIEWHCDGLQKFFGDHKKSSPITTRSNKILAGNYLQRLKRMLKFIDEYYNRLNGKLDSDHKVMKKLVTLKENMPNLVKRYQKRIDESEY